MPGNKKDVLKACRSSSPCIRHLWEVSGQRGVPLLSDVCVSSPKHSSLTSLLGDLVSNLGVVLLGVFSRNPKERRNGQDLLKYGYLSKEACCQAQQQKLEKASEKAVKCSQGIEGTSPVLGGCSEGAQGTGL